MNTSLMIELKHEYTTQLINILSPVILEGLQSLYTTARNSSEKTNILKTFQSLLKRIPNWDYNMINKELTRIELQTKKTPWVFQLIQAVFKINMLIYNLEPSENLKNELNMGQFIHFVYIECAREFWMDPFLFYDDYPSYEVKRNYLEIMKKIGCSIENAIRRLLPMGMILDKFLGLMTVNGKQLDLSEVYSMPVLLDIPLKMDEPKTIKENYNSILNQVENQNGGGNMNEFINVMPTATMPTATMPTATMPTATMPTMPQTVQQVAQQIPNQPMILIPQQGGQMIMQPIAVQQNPQTDILDKNVNDQILNILNKNNVLTESNDNNNFTIHNHSALPPQSGGNNFIRKNSFGNNSIGNNSAGIHSIDRTTIVNPVGINPAGLNMMGHDATGNNSIGNNSIGNNTDKRSSSALKRIINESIKQSQHNNIQRSHSVHSEMKTKILKELETETVYKPEENVENYQDVFSNSEIKNTINTQDKVEKKTREKFFTNYLNI